MADALDHRSFVITRTLPGRPAHAFRFWSDHALKRRWNSCHPDWHVTTDRFDFRIDGSEELVWIMPNGTRQSLIAHFLDIEAPGRIVYAYAMRTDSRPLSSSLVTVQFTPGDAQTLMTYTEQAVFAHATDGDIREAGTGLGFDRLAAMMNED